MRYKLIGKYQNPSIDIYIFKLISLSVVAVAIAVTVVPIATHVYFSNRWPGHNWQLLLNTPLTWSAAVSTAFDAVDAVLPVFGLRA